MTDNFYYLKVGDVIQEGDEFFTGNAWYPCELLLGFVVTKGEQGTYRRPLPAEHPQMKKAKETVEFWQEALAIERRIAEHAERENAALRAEVERLKAERDKALLHVESVDNALFQALNSIRDVRATAQSAGHHCDWRAMCDSLHDKLRYHSANPFEVNPYGRIAREIDALKERNWSVLYMLENVRGKPLDADQIARLLANIESVITTGAPAK